MVVAFIPSPSHNVLSLGPLSVHFYGICIALGVVAAVWLSTKRWTARGGNPDDITAIATVGVPAGIIGARLYHLATDWELYKHDPLRAFAIWDGGLGIWGGIGLGVVAGLWMAKQRNLPLLTMLDIVAPALALAQALGRFGNYFNQELFGGPTKLPWGLKIDVTHRPDGYLQYSTFHPTFLYESLWNLLLCGTLLLIDRKHPLRAGRLFALYVAGYTFARFFIERLRIDYAHKIAGLRINDWMSLLIFLIAVTCLVWPTRDNKPSDTPSSDTHSVA